MSRRRCDDNQAKSSPDGLDGLVRDHSTGLQLVPHLWPSLLDFQAQLGGEYQREQRVDYDVLQFCGSSNHVQLDAIPSAQIDSAKVDQERHNKANNNT